MEEKQIIYNVRQMTMDDYPAVYKLWKTIRGFGLRSIDDSKEGVACFLRRNPTTSIVAERDGSIIGCILCGHDGRRGCFYHVCVAAPFRRHGIGRAMAVQAMQALQAEQINQVCLIAFKNNEAGNGFWKSVGWTKREDMNYYEFILNEENMTRFNA